VTPTSPGGRAVVLEVAPDDIFGMFHAPSGQSISNTAVLICPPWGWDEVASYRSRRAWADRLAADGHATLRIDLPGSGDSAGSPSDPNRMEAWVGAVTGSAAWLASLPGVSRVAVIGLGLGGLVAAKAVADGAPVDDLVMWGTPARGTAFLREQRAFAALQSSSLSPHGEPVPNPLPEGWLEVGGFVLSAATSAAIASLELATLPPGALQRVLLLERDGMGRDRDLETRLASLGIDVAAAAGNGWTDMVFHPERYTPPLVVIDRVAAWLAEAPAEGSRATTSEASRAADAMELVQDETRIRESPIHLDQPFGQLFGLLAEPVDRPRADVCAVFLNAGAVRRIGPNRLWVETARRWTARGVPTIRMDMEGLGDADGDPARYLDVGNFYTPEFGAQVGAILDDLETRGFGPRFVLIGLCAGGYWAFHTAAADARVVAALIINPRAMIWDADLLTRREAQKVERLLEPALWQRVVRGKVPVSRMVAVSRAVASRASSTATRAPGRLRAARRSERGVDPTLARFDALHDLGTRVLLAFSDDEPVYDELKADGILARLDRWPNVELKHLPQRDHTLRPIVAQRALSEMLDLELGDLLGGAGG
jgi:pimeloyl-ACP methyl ester carboxylesterase